MSKQSITRRPQKKNATVDKMFSRLCGRIGRLKSKAATFTEWDEVMHSDITIGDIAAKWRHQAPLANRAEDFPDHPRRRLAILAEVRKIVEAVTAEFAAHEHCSELVRDILRTLDVRACQLQLAGNLEAKRQLQGSHQIWRGIMGRLAAAHARTAETPWMSALAAAFSCRAQSRHARGRDGELVSDRIRSCADQMHSTPEILLEAIGKLWVSHA